MTSKAWTFYKKHKAIKDTSDIDEHRIEPSMVEAGYSFSDDDQPSPYIQNNAEDKAHAIIDVDIVESSVAPVLNAETKTDSNIAPVADAAPKRKEWDKVLAFTVMAKEGDIFSGKAVKAMLEKLDFHFGDMKLYHRQLADMDQEITITVANILDPGTLDPANFIAMKTPGLLVFVHLYGEIDGVSYFDTLSATTQAIVERLNGSLCDESRRVLTASRIETLRNQVVRRQAELAQ